MGETDCFKRGLVFRKDNGRIILLEDRGDTLHLKEISDYNNIYDALTNQQASIVEINNHPLGGIVLRDVAVLDFSKDFGEAPCTAWEAIDYSLKTDPQELLEVMYNDPEPIEE